MYIVYYLFLAVLSRIHILIGRFAKDYPDCIEIDDAQKIRDMYFKALEKAVIMQQDVNYSIDLNLNFVRSASTWKKR